MLTAERSQSKAVREWLYSLRARGMKLGLDNMQRAMRILDLSNPGPVIVHVAGTNGKGSVSAMITAILSAAGLRVGLYTSPHLIDLKERITINNVQINEAKLSELINRVKHQLEEQTSPPVKLTFFEYITAVAMSYFSENEVDVIVAETGLGGRYDATNVLESSVSVITRIGIDHTDQLGNTIESIAREKAGIIKEGVGVISSAKEPLAMRIIRSRASDLNCTLIEQGKDFRYGSVHCDLNATIFDYEGTRKLDEIKTNLLGTHQAENCATAIATCDLLAGEKNILIDSEQVLKGLKKVKWHGRLEIISHKPLILVDCGHNQSAVRETLSSLCGLGKLPDTVIFACSKDKDYKGIASILFPSAKRLILTKYANERALEPRILAELPGSSEKQIFITESVAEAIGKAKLITPDDETVLIIGSIFLVGETLSLTLYGNQADLEMAGF